MKIRLPAVLVFLFERRVRGFRLAELAGAALLAVLVLAVYFFKAGAGQEGAQIADTTRQIQAEERRVRALKAELARLEAPDRIERLAVGYLGLVPASPKREAEVDTVGPIVGEARRAPR